MFGPVQRKVKDLCIDVEKNPETKATLDLGMKKNISPMLKGVDSSVGAAGAAGTASAPRLLSLQFSLQGSRGSSFPSFSNFAV